MSLTSRDGRRRKIRRDDGRPETRSALFAVSSVIGATGSPQIAPDDLLVIGNCMAG